MESTFPNPLQLLRWKELYSTRSYTSRLSAHYERARFMQQTGSEWQTLVSRKQHSAGRIYSQSRFKENNIMFFSTYLDWLF
jgi:hypothetical protein